MLQILLDRGYVTTAAVSRLSGEVKAAERGVVKPEPKRTPDVLDIMETVAGVPLSVELGYRSLADRVRQAKDPAVQAEALESALANSILRPDEIRYCRKLLSDGVADPVKLLDCVDRLIEEQKTDRYHNIYRVVVESGIVSLEDFAAGRVRPEEQPFLEAAAAAAAAAPDPLELEKQAAITEAIAALDRPQTRWDRLRGLAERLPAMPELRKRKARRQDVIRDVAPVDRGLKPNEVRFYKIALQNQLLSISDIELVRAKVRQGRDAKQSVNFYQQCRIEGLLDDVAIKTIFRKVAAGELPMETGVEFHPIKMTQADERLLAEDEIKFYRHGLQMGIFDLGVVAECCRILRRYKEANTGCNLYKLMREY